MEVLEHISLQGFLQQALNLNLNSKANKLEPDFFQQLRGPPGVHSKIQPHVQQN